MKDWDNNHRTIRRLDLYHVVSNYWVAHSEVLLIWLAAAVGGDRFGTSSVRFRNNRRLVLFITIWV